MSSRFKKITVERVEDKKQNSDRVILMMFFERHSGCDAKWLTVEDAKNIQSQLQKILQINEK